MSMLIRILKNRLNEVLPLTLGNIKSIDVPSK